MDGPSIVDGDGCDVTTGSGEPAQPRPTRAPAPTAPPCCAILCKQASHSPWRDAACLLLLPSPNTCPSAAHASATYLPNHPCPHGAQHASPLPIISRAQHGVNWRWTGTVGGHGAINCARTGAHGHARGRAPRYHQRAPSSRAAGWRAKQTRRGIAARAALSRAHRRSSGMAARQSGS